MSANRKVYPLLVQRLRAMRRYDEMLALASAVAALRMAALLVERAQQARGEVANVRRLQCEAMKARRELEYATAAVIEAIGDEPGGDDLVASILGNDDGRTLAQIIIDDGEE